MVFLPCKLSFDRAENVVEYFQNADEWKPEEQTENSSDADDKIHVGLHSSPEKTLKQKNLNL